MVDVTRRALLLTILSTLVACTALIGCDDEGGEVEILSMEPQTGTLQGENPVKIGGRNFRTDIGYTVYFGNQRARQVTILDQETLLVITPPRDEAGDVDVTIRADDGAAFRIAGGFHYEDRGGNVVEHLGAGPTKSKKGNLAY